MTIICISNIVYLGGLTFKQFGSDVEAQEWSKKMNDEFCPKHDTWFGRDPMQCPGCVAEYQKRQARNEGRRTRRLDKRDGFASLRDMRYTECPCGCGSKEVCEAQRARVKAHNDSLPF